MEQELVLIISSGDWADEFDLEGFAIFTKERWEYIKEGIPEGSFEAYYGSNEEVTFESKDDYLNYMTEKSISLEEMNFICKLLNLTPLRFTNEYDDHLTYGLFVVNSENF